MSKILVILLSFSILIQSFNMNLEDMPKIPILVNHLISHLEQGESISDFITKHYGSEIASHKDEHKEHKDLPFKQHHLDAHFHIDFIVSTHSYPLKMNDDFYASKNFMYKEKCVKIFEVNFFQPPKHT